MVDTVRFLSASPTVDTSAYAAGDLIGGKLSFDLSFFKGGPSLLIQSALLVDEAKQSAAIDIVLWDSNPSGTTFTDQAALDIADADVPKIVGIIPFSFYSAFADNGIGWAGNLAMPLRVDPTLASPTLYAALVSRGTPTFAAATDVTLRLGFIGQ